MDFHAMLVTLRRHQLSAAMIAVTTAIGYVLSCHAVGTITTLLAEAAIPTGTAENELLVVQVSEPRGRRLTELEHHQETSALAALPGVVSVTLSNQIPFGGSAWRSSIHLDGGDFREDVIASVYLGDAVLRQTLGVTLLQGRDLRTDESAGGQQKNIQSALISNSLSRRLFPSGDAIGKFIHLGQGIRAKVVGVTDDLIDPFPHGKSPDCACSVITSGLSPSAESKLYVIRTHQFAQKQHILDAAKIILRQKVPSRIFLKSASLESLRETYFQGHRNKALFWTLACMAWAILVAASIAATGILWAQQRTRQISLRRALGATSHQINAYMRKECLLLTTTGIVLGIGLCLAADFVHNERPWQWHGSSTNFVPLAVFWLFLGQLAILIPARTAAAISPAAITRNA